MGSYLEWFRSCSRITVTAHPAIAVPAGFTRRRAADRAAARRPPPRRGSRCCGSPTRSPRRPGSPRARRSSRCPGRRRRRPPRTAPPTPTPSRARSGCRRRASRTPGADGRRPTPTCASSAAASPACGRRCTRRPTTRRATSSLLEAETAGFGASGRNGGFAVASLTHGIENGLARFADEMAALERLGLENFAGLRADLERHGIDCDFEPTGELLALTDAYQEPWLEEERGVAARASATRSTVLDARRDARRGRLAHLPRRRLGPHRRRRSSTPASSPPGCATPRSAPACACTSTPPCTTCATAGARVEALTAAGRVRAAPRPARHQRLSAAAARDPPLRRAGLRLRAGHRAADAAQRASIGWQHRQGIGDGGNQFHYYRLTADDRILFGGWDAVYRYGGPVGPRHDEHDADLRHARPALLPHLPAARGPALHPPLGRRDRHLVAASRSSSAPPSAAASPTPPATPASASPPPASAAASRSTCSTAATPRPPACATSAPSRSRSRPSRCAGRSIQFTRNRLAAADRNDGRRGPWLRLLDRLGLGFDS